ncbi:hypothetical protein GY45DRAFT_1331624 [Cubamyces sp. BRFM 1775]|nr:hypothetical protein GY45DRAFT_1331624 [Cubamyces sp. BRFM 1775]
MSRVALDNGATMILNKESCGVEHAHGKGYMHGAPYTIGGAAVKSKGGDIAFKTVDDGCIAKAKHRIVFEGSGHDLTIAQSVNDLLKAVYDTLEVHRTLTSVRRVLHRDMNIFNLLMYPQWRSCNDKQSVKHCSPLIDDVLHGELRKLENRKACCVVIDLDNSEKPGHAHLIKQLELQHRAGTPPYISRAIANGIFCHSHASMLWTKRMPHLAGEAKDLYLKVLGEDKYNQYNDPPTSNIFHGGVPPQEYDEDDMENKAKSLELNHRCEYDAESVFWTMYSALLRVTPVGFEETPTTARRFNKDWAVLCEHSISSQRQPADSRDEILAYARSHFIAAFPEIMAPVGRLIRDIAAHVAPSYAMMEQLPPHDDHLHEAMQRLILQYLVDNLTADIPLVPGKLRVPFGKEEPAPISSTAGGTAGESRRAQERGSGQGQEEVQKQWAQAQHAASRPDAKGARGLKRSRDPATDDLASLRRSKRLTSQRK